MRKVAVTALLSLAFSNWIVAVAFAAGPEFSAVRVQSMPDKGSLSSPVFMSGQRMRTEMTREGQTYVLIVNAQEQTAWHIDPAKKQYVELRAPSEAGTGGVPAPLSKPALPDEPGSPCAANNPNLQCKKLGSERIGDRDTDKWEFVFTPPQQQQPLRSIVWIDRELRIPLREEGPGGMTSELRDLKIGPQPDSLFQVPTGFTRIEVPAQPAGGPPTGGRPAPSTTR
jgi:hypothetical protein